MKSIQKKFFLIKRLSKFLKTEEMFKHMAVSILWNPEEIYRFTTKSKKKKFTSINQLDQPDFLNLKKRRYYEQNV